MIINKNTLITYIFFIFSPIFSIPLILIQLFNNVNKGMVLLISALYALLSFKYIPNITNDKKRYIERFDLFSGYDFKELINYFVTVKRPDFVFDGINFAFSKLGLGVNYFFFFITFVTIYLYFCFIKLQCSKMSNKKFLFGIFTVLFVVFSVSLPSIFSGVRFLFAGSIFVWGVYFLFADDRRLWLVFCLFLTSALTHYSFILLIFAALFSVVNYKRVVISLILFVSLLLLFGTSVAKESFESILSFLTLPESYLNKASLYMQEDIESSFNAKILSFLRHLWLFYLMVFLFFNYERNSKYYAFIVNLVFVVCFVSFIDTAFYRYALFLKILFVPYVFYLSTKRESAGTNVNFLLFSVFYFLGFVVDIVVIRDNIAASYSSGVWSLYEILTTSNADISLVE
ncbi:EpsG family protein [Pseudoalteromonas sp. NC201]|uniref:EpsG family protein n=1 Tax=Pseudoalteromonas sp. NC201 TaxID=1514074 RepID=UPI0013052078|nr:EpsG family protein [Pseudoalteromonas sp. NC201]